MSNIRSIVCSVCNDTFQTRTYSESCWCASCTTIHSQLMKCMNLMTNMPSSIPIYSDYYIRITYLITQKQHDGYCSDTDYQDVTSIDSVEKFIFPLIKQIKQTDIDPVTGQIQSLFSNPWMKLYQIDPDSTCYCDNGERTFTIQTAQVVERPSLIKLD
jgi:hypothetical protein